MNFKKLLSISIDYKSKTYLPHLDGLRGIAILLVLFAHFFKFQPFAKLAETGWMGVDLFFVLSGFLITGILVESKQKENYFKNFYARRTLRIFPVYYLILLILLFILPAITSNLPEGYDYFLHRKWFYVLYFQNNLFAIDGWPPNEMLSHLWSLAIEEQFYLFWPLVVFFFNKNQTIIFAIIVIVFNIFMRYQHPDVPFAYCSSAARFDGLLIGGLLAIMIRFHRDLLEKFTLPVFIICSLALGYAFWNSQWKLTNSNYYLIRWGYTVIDIFWACIMVFSFSANKIYNWANPMYESRFLRFFGKLSYGLYLYHMIVFGFFAKSLVQFFHNLNMPNVNEHGIEVSMSVLFITITISYISFTFFEAPILKLKSRFH